MKNLRDSLRIYMEGDGAGGAGSSTPPAPPTTSPPPATPPPSSSSPATPPASNAPAAPPAAPADEGTILGAAKANPPATPPPGTPPAAAPAPDEAAITTFVDSVKADLGEYNGKPVELNKDTVKAIAPVALKHKLTPEVIGEIISAYGAHERKSIDAFIAQEKAEAAAARQKVQQEFGSDLPTFVQDAAKGAKFFFGEELMGRMFNDKGYGNDPVFIKSMAQLGRMVKTDGGIGGTPQGGEKEFWDRWMESSSPKKG